MATQSEKESTTRPSERNSTRETYSGSSSSHRESSEGSRREQAGAYGTSSGTSHSGQGSTAPSQGNREHAGARSSREPSQSGMGGNMGNEDEGGQSYRGRMGYEREQGSGMNPHSYGADSHLDEWTHRAQQAIHPLEEYAREKPLTSLLIAAGVGVVFGMLFLRK